MSKIGHNNPPPDGIVHTVWLVRHEDGTRELVSDLSTARPLPGKDRHGLMRPARDYAFEKAVTKLNRRK